VSALASASPAFELVNTDGSAPAIVTCDHAGRAIPAEDRDLGLSARDLERHIAWDIGGADLSRELARRLDAPAVLATYSRLFIDANRQPGSTHSIPALSDGVAIAGNAGLSPAAIARRADIAFWPYHRRIAALIADRERRSGVQAIVMIHTFTPAMNGQARPWHVGVLYDRDARMAKPLLAALGRQQDLIVGDNQPYSGSSPLGYGLDAHGQSVGRPHVMIEVRQDLVETPKGAARWVARLAPAVAEVLADPALFVLRRA
jgi:predicted N-formylglutamate amidohydrolase